MNEANNTLRKAAVLLSSIDERSAEELLGQMTPEQAGAVRRAMSELRHVDPNEQEAIVREFRIGTSPRKSAGVELDPGLERALERERAIEASQRKQTVASNWFATAPLDDLVEALSHERPQTIAVVVSKLPPDRAAHVLGSLDPLTRTDVVERLLALDETHPEAFADIERAIRGMVERRAKEVRRRASGVETLRGILGAAGEGAAREALIASVVTREPSIVADFLPAAPETAPWTFADIESLNDAPLAQLLSAADAETRRLALAGATPELFQRALRVLPPNAASELQRQITTLGPARLSDLEAAQHDLALLAEQLCLGEAMIDEIAGDLHGVTRQK